MSKLDFKANENSTAAYVDKEEAKKANKRTAIKLIKLLKPTPIKE